MAICPNCGHSNRAGSLICESCDHQLHPGISYGTALTKAPSPEHLPQPRGTARFAYDRRLVIQVGNTPILLALKPNETFTLGRATPEDLHQLDIDLTPYQAQELGVSRLHARIQRSPDGLTLTLEDLGSTNGTYLNRTRLTPHSPTTLRDRDIIYLSKLHLCVQFARGSI